MLVTAIPAWMLHKRFKERANECWDVVANDVGELERESNELGF